MGKGRLDTHFYLVNSVFQSDVESGNNIRREQQRNDALCHNCGLRVL
jgi:hypothetical protein